MSDTPSLLSQAAQDAGVLRQMYERWSFIIVPAVVVLVILVAIAACLWPTPYGQLVIGRLLQISSTIMELIGVLLGGAGLTMARGHFDERLKQGEK